MTTWQQIKQIWLIVGGIVIITLAYDWITGKSNDKPEDLSSMAFIQCQNFVKQDLKSPSTAAFPSFDYKSSKQGEYTYAISSYVDAQNSFGAKIRSNYSCQVLWKGGKPHDIQNWRLMNLTMS